MHKSKVDVHRRKLEFKEGNLVVVYLRNERFSVNTYNKLKQRKFGPCRALKKVGPRAYCIEIPTKFSISPTFNLCDLYP